MVALITGGCGFIGSHVADALVASGQEVIILDNLSTGKKSNAPTAARVVVADVADEVIAQDLVNKADVVFHLAAIASVEACNKDLMNAHRTNLTGTVTVLDAAAKSPKKPLVVYASSAAVYGDNPNLPLAEEAETKPLGAYGLDKLSGEKYAQLAWQFHGVASVGLRFFNVFGTRQDPHSPYSGVISKFVQYGTLGQPITYFGDGEQTRDFIHVSDIVALLLAASKIKQGAVIANGCTGKATSLKQLAAAIGKTLGRALETNHAPARQGDIRHSLGNPARAEELLGFRASTSLAQGLEALVREMKQEIAHA